VVDDPPGATIPLFFVQVQSLERLQESLSQLAGTVGREKGFNDGLLRFKKSISALGLEGVEPGKPWGVYIRLSDDFSAWALVVLAPITDESKFLRLLTDLTFEKESQTGDLTAFRVPPLPAGLALPIPIPMFAGSHPHDTGRLSSPVPSQIPLQLPERIYARFAEGYAHILLAGDPNLLVGSKLLPAPPLFANHDGKLLTATFRIDRIPLAKRQDLTNQIRDQSMMLVSAIANETLRDFARLISAPLADFTSSLLQDGRNISLLVDLDRKTQALLLDLYLQGQKASSLEGRLAALALPSSTMAALPSEEAALGLLLHARLPEALRKALPAAVSNATRSILSDIKDPNEREKQETIFVTLGPTFAAGELDFAAALCGNENGKGPSSVAAVKIANGQELDNLMQRVANEPQNKEIRGLIDFQAEQLDGSVAHRINWHRYDNAFARANFGANPSYMVFRPDVLIVSTGYEGKQLVEQALRATRKPPPADTKSPLARLTINLQKLFQSPVVGLKTPATRPTMLTDEHPGRFRVELAGGDSLRLHVRMELSFLRFVASLIPTMIRD